MRHNKLVRGRLPAAIAATGRRSQVRQLAPEDFRAALRAKLLEETAECAYLPEVIAAVAELEGIGWGAGVALREREAGEHGAFRDRMLLISAG
jgi:predicted house-cleaning noncanonical NTP pyrophosphatase (MazG superfamily)